MFGTRAKIVDYRGSYSSNKDVFPLGMNAFRHRWILINATLISQRERDEAFQITPYSLAWVVDWSPIRSWSKVVHYKGGKGAIWVAETQTESCRDTNRELQRHKQRVAFPTDTLFLT